MSDGPSDARSEMESGGFAVTGAPPVRSKDLLAGSPTWPIVLEFAKRMEAKLELNRHKGNREGWINDDPFALLKRLREETKELNSEMLCAQVRMHETANIEGQCERIANEAADVANFAMMLADWYQARAS